MTRPRAPATLADVAEAAQVHVSTASRVLSGEAAQRVTEETRNRIREAASRLGYRPNAVARALRTSRTSTIGMVVPQLDNPVFAAAIRGAETTASRLGYSLLISHRSPGAAAASIARLSHMNQIDGLLVASLDDDEVLRSDLEDARIPYVLLNRTLPGDDACVVLDGREAALIGVEHLVALGHRRIAHLAGRAGGFNARERHAGYRAGLEAAGLPYDADLVAVAGYTAEGGQDAMRLLLPRRPTAILAATLLSAAGALAVLHEAGLRVPEDVSVVGLHDAPVAAMLYPPLTTVRMPTEEMGSVAATRLIRHLAGEPSGAVPPLAPAVLVRRSSTAPPPRDPGRA